jgi:hypothetical protein
VLKALGIRTLKRGLLGFWAIYFTLVFVSNAFDALKALGVVGARFPFASGNYAMIVAATAKLAPFAALNAILFAGVLAWEALAAALFWSAFRRVRHRGPVETAAFVTSIALWAAFVLADELFLAYEGGTEGTHVRLFLAQLVSLLAIHLLPDDRPSQ